MKPKKMVIGRLYWLKNGDSLFFYRGGSCGSYLFREAEYDEKRGYYYPSFRYINFSSREVKKMREFESIGKE